MPICAAFRRERSRNGVTLSVLKSGLQKYVRRGEAEKALWCAGELLSFRDAPSEEKPQRVVTNFRHRLMIIALEDAGVLGLVPRLDQLRTGWTRAATRQEEESAVHEWVSILVASRKGRVCSHARAVASAYGPKGPVDARACALAADLYPDVTSLYAQFAGEMKKTPDSLLWKGALERALRAASPTAVCWAWAIQEHGPQRTEKGGRKAVWTIFAALESSCPGVAPYVSALRLWYRELQNLKEAFLCWMLPLLAGIAGTVYEPDDGLYVRPGGELFPDAGPVELDDYVYDIHVGAGAARGGGGLVRFAVEGSLVTNESGAVNRVWKAFYEDRKRLAEGAEPVGPPASPPPPVPEPLPDDFIDSLFDDLPAEEPEPGAPEPGAPELPPDIVRETQFEFLVRAQINTGRGKTDVYFAHPPGSKSVVVVKGPFESETPVENAVKMARWKVINGLPAARTWGVSMVPDRWPRGVPLGVRNRVDRSQPAAFLVSDSLLPGPPPRRLHEATAKWPATEVVDWEQLAAHRWRPLSSPAPISDLEKVDYVLILLARFLAGISDHADRNFIRAGGRLYSLDEDSRTTKVVTSFLCELRKNKSALVLRWLAEFEETVSLAVASWIIPGAPGAWERYGVISDPASARGLFL